MWTCPACQTTLNRIEKQWRCSNNHCYDIAKEGYVNLLLAHQKSSKEPGDNKAMINARRHFLQLGHYQPLTLVLSTLVRNTLQTSSINLYDMGCGEGYYLGEITAELEKRGHSVAAAGSDISKIAIQKAAKKYSAANFAVANNFQLPLADHSQKMLMQIFTPADRNESVRVLSAGGFWIQVSPAPGHLAQIRQAIYQLPEQHEVDERVPDGFSVVEKQQLNFEFAPVERLDRERLLMMTPYAWVVDKNKLPEVLNNMDRVTADFSIRILRKE